MRLTIDMETRSVVDLKKHGEWVYSEHPLTDVLCCAVKADGESTGIWINERWWFPSCTRFDCLSSSEFGALVETADTIEAHNASFERAMWVNVMHGRYGFPVIPEHKWRCSAAKAAAFSLPRSLEGAGAALGLAVQKDQAGKRVMLRLCKPERQKKGDTSIRWNEDQRDLLALYQYCIQDVEAEHAISQALPDLNEIEQQVYLLDQIMNERGFRVDVEAARRIIEVVKVQETMLLEEVRDLTEGKINSVKQVAAMCSYCGIASLTKQSVAAALKRDDLTPTVRRLLEIRKILGLSSIAKYQAAIDRACADQRIRGSLVYHAAGTGRWAGKGFQPQNLPRENVKEKYVDLALNCFRDAEAADALDMFFGDPVSVGKGLIRSMIVAPSGRELACADFAGIEARVLLWLAEDEEGLDIFREGRDIYCEMAESVFGFPVTKEANPFERQIGKTCILGLGFQMGWRKFHETSLSQGISLDKKLARKAVNAYREKFSKTRDLWRYTDQCARYTVNSGEGTTAGRVQYRMWKNFLQCRLPSGRVLSYADPQILTEPMYLFKTVDADGTDGSIVVTRVSGIGRAREEAIRQARVDEVEILDLGKELEREYLTYMGNVGGQWVRESTSGGKLVENNTQAVARDLMAEAMLRLEAAGYPVILTVHDEIVSEVPEGTVDLKTFENLMSVLPEWGIGIPVESEGWIGKRYRK